MPPNNRSFETPGRLRVLQCVSVTLGLIFFVFLGYSAVKYDDPHQSVFGSYWASARAALDGRDPYAIYPETYRSNFSGTVVADRNLNPPILLPLFEAMAHRPLPWFARAWTIGSLVCFSIAILLAYRTVPTLHPYQILWLFAMTPTVITVRTGQLYGLLFLLATIAFASGAKRPLIASAAIGLLVALKPTMVFLPFFLWLAGHRKTAYAAAGTAAAVTAIPLPIFGFAAYRQWFAVLHGDPHWISSSDIALIAVFRRTGHTGAGIALAILLLIALAWWIHRQKPGINDANGIAACASVLCSPLAWPAYLLVATPFFIARRWNSIETAGAFLLVIPAGIALLAGSTLYLVSVFIMLAAFYRGSSLRLHLPESLPAAKVV